MGICSGIVISGIKSGVVASENSVTSLGVIFPVLPVLVIFGFEIIDVVVFEIENQNYFLLRFLSNIFFSHH